MRHVDKFVEDSEADWAVDDAQTSDEHDHEEQSKPVWPVKTTTTELDMEFDDEEDQYLALTKTLSRHSPLELTICNY